MIQSGLDVIILPNELEVQSGPPFFLCVLGGLICQGHAVASSIYDSWSAACAPQAWATAETPKASRAAFSPQPNCYPTWQSSSQESTGSSDNTVNWRIPCPSGHQEQCGAHSPAFSSGSPSSPHFWGHPSQTSLGASGRSSHCPRCAPEAPHWFFSLHVGLILNNKSGFTLPALFLLLSETGSLIVRSIGSRDVQETVGGGRCWEQKREKKVRGVGMIGRRL